MRKKEWLSYEEAKNIVIKLGIPNYRAWQKFAISKNRPVHIPFNPQRIYKNKGWVNWVEWLGTNNKPGGHGSYRKYKVNDNYFKKFTSNMAYTLGFWMADGCMDERLGRFSITQHKKDKYILENILKDMCSNNILTNCVNNRIFVITSREIINDVKNFGGHQAKSLTIKFPKNISKKYMPDFIRGLWDGDGSVIYRKQTKDYVSSYVSASKLFTYDLLKILQKEIYDFKGTITKRKNKNAYVVQVGINDTRRLRDYIYKNTNTDSLFLKRKYDRFKNAGAINIKGRRKHV